MQFGNVNEMTDSLCDFKILESYGDQHIALVEDRPTDQWPPSGILVRLTLRQNKSCWPCPSSPDMLILGPQPGMPYTSGGLWTICISQASTERQLRGAFSDTSDTDPLRYAQLWPRCRSNSAGGGELTLHQRMRELETEKEKEGSSK